MGGHSRRCAKVVEDAARLLGSTEDAVTTLRRAAWLHEFGTTAVPNSIWDKPGPLTRAERDRVELHPMLTEQMLRRTSALDLLNSIASRHHERADGSGYHKGLRADATDRGCSPPPTSTWGSRPSAPTVPRSPQATRRRSFGGSPHRTSSTKRPSTPY